jgi:crossover junction endodeoxyribonuclease RusA
MRWVAAVTVTLPWPVSANAYWRTRVITPRTGGAPRAITYVSKEAEQYKESVGWMLRNAGVRRALQGRVRIDMQLRPSCPQDWKKRARENPLWWADTVRRPDLDNARKVLYDALKGIAIEDDIQVWKDTAEVLEPEEGVGACVVVRISRCEKDDPRGVLPL